MGVADRDGIGTLAGFTPAGSATEELVRRSIEAAAWHLSLTPRVFTSEADLRTCLTGKPGILLMLEATECMHAALSAGWIVLTSRRHRDARHGQELFWVASQRPEVLLRALIDVGRRKIELLPIRARARALADSLTPEEFFARWAPPLVSVIMPLYNDEEELAAGIRSVLSQTIGDIELILVDDESTDASRARSYEIEDPRITRLWRSGGGPSAARNAGLAFARAESYLAFLDSDDRWAPLFLERMVETLEAAPPRAGLAYCDCRYSLDDGAETIRSAADASFPALVLSDGLIPIGSFVFRRSVLDEAGLLDEHIERGEDYEWLLRVAARFDLVRVPEALFHYRRSSHGQLLTTALDQRRMERLRLDAFDAWTQRVLSRARVP
jgi:GT2 family glycosyltransferase